MQATNAAGRRAARVAAPAAGFTSELTAPAEGGAGLRFTGTFRVGEDCGGPATFAGDISNHGTLFVGRLRLEGACFDGGVGTGTFYFRRAAR